MKLYFRDVNKKLRVVEADSEFDLNEQKGLRKFIEENSTIRVKGAILSLTESGNIYPGTDPQAA